MRQTLRLHPNSSCGAVTTIEVDVAHPRARTLVFTYAVSGTISDLAIPSRAVAARTDELWRHTCFEAFIGNSVDATYYEFNFAPSTQWAAYWFSGYRSGMRVATEINRPQISVKSAPECYLLEASVELDQESLSHLRLGLAAVIEKISGHRSYWALVHPPGKADFHHSDCFMLELET
jgi:hypothetical protein